MLEICTIIFVDLILLVLSLRNAFWVSGNVLAIEEKLWYGHTRSWDCGVWPWQWGIMMSDGATKGQCNHEQPCSVSSHFCQAHYLQWAPSKGDINFLLFHHCNRRDVQTIFLRVYICLRWCSDGNSWLFYFSVLWILPAFCV